MTRMRYLAAAAVVPVILCATSVSFAKRATNPSDANQAKKKVIAAARMVSEAAEQLDAYFASMRGKSAETLHAREPYPKEVPEKLANAVTQVEAVIACCKASIDEAKVRNLGKTANELATFSEEWINGQIKTRGRDFLAGARLALSVAKIDADDIIDELSQIFFSNTWKLGKGTFLMRAHVDRAWKENLNQAGIEDRLVPLVVEMANATGSDFEFNPMIHKFVVITSAGTQVDPAEISFEIYSAIGELGGDVENELYHSVRTVYDGGKVALVVLYRDVLPPPEQWRRIIFENPFGGGVRLHSVPMGSLTR